MKLYVYIYINDDQDTLREITDWDTGTHGI